MAGQKTTTLKPPNSRLVTYTKYKFSYLLKFFRVRFSVTCNKHLAFDKPDGVDSANSISPKASEDENNAKSSINFPSCNHLNGIGNRQKQYQECSLLQRKRRQNVSATKEVVEVI